MNGLAKWQKETMNDLEVGDTFVVLQGRFAGTVYTVARKTEDTLHCTTNSQVTIRVFWSMEWDTNIEVK